MKKLLLLGLDGVPYSLIRNFAKQGFNFLSYLLNTWVNKEIASTIPEISSVAWSSFITGKNPGENNIFGFTEIDEYYRLYFPTYEDLKASPFWEIYDKLYYVIVNVPSTYPVSPINGVIISGFVSPVFEKSIYPQELTPFLREIDYKIDVDAQLAHTDKDRFIEDLFQCLEKRVKLYEKIREYPWDVLMFVITGTDRLLHFMWDSIYQNSSIYYKAVMEYFRKVENILEKILSDYRDADFIVFSDHGFCGLKKDIFINNMLTEYGLLQIDKKDKFFLEGVDARSYAFSLDPARIYVNKVGKFIKGRVKSSEVKDVIKKIKEIFDSFYINSEKVIKHIYSKEQIYKGKFVEKAPDIVLVPYPGFNLKSAMTSSSIVQDSIFTGMHTYEDAFLITNIKEMSDVKNITQLGKRVCEYIKRLNSEK